MDELGDNELIQFVLDNEDSNEMELELVTRLGSALGEIDLLVTQLHKTARELQVAQYPVPED